ncbi:DUF6950 family protein [Sphingomonas nostoxanthinifaciens]|uniref:DUF6950 family protein n=1 Tax=Sphingomonas nostoxanthinifaciens TaxID=2872652 RepID=UPI001CC1C86C|nr:hypothetical protein [Sphingomonas nostoxanthinifaciens]UAK23678.1 hypothetical protein K8P63_15000 [Sphingomonas nostoxanthinifaciens]
MTDPDMLRRRDAAQATLDRFRTRKLRLGVNDCVRMGAFHLRKMGRKVQLPPTGAYSTVRGALKQLQARGFDDVAAALDAMGLPRIPPASAVVGDFLMLPANTALGSLTIALGNGRVVGYHEDVPGGAAVLQPVEFLDAWRVDPFGSSK